jgi:transcriptional regulator with XRE-family HTH domain
MVTDRQVLRYLEKRRRGFTQEQAACAAGMAARTARKWEKGQLPSMSMKHRTWRTRDDPLAEVWDDEVVPLLKLDEDRKLQSTTILDVLKAKPDAAVGDGQLRTLQRRVRDWRATEGPGKEVFFEQEHPPGREAQVDFTHAKELCCAASSSWGSRWRSSRAWALP